MKENQILVIMKQPGKGACVEPLFDNTLKAFQTAVGGYIETVTIAEDVCLIVNEEGILRGLPYNTTVGGQPLLGTVIVVGVRGEDFVSLKSSRIPRLLQLINGGEYE